MTNLRRALFAGANAWRQPKPVTTRRVAGRTRPGTIIVDLCDARQLPIAASTLLGETARGVGRVVILPTGRAAIPAPTASLARGLAAQLRAGAEVAIGERIPGRRWERAARNLDVGHVALGAAGWTRIVLDDPLAVLDSAYMPVELDLASHIVVVPAGNPLTVWRAVAHPLTTLRASVGAERNRAALDLCACMEATYVVLVGSPSRPAVAWSTNAFAAQLVSLASSYLRDERRSIEAQLPWEATLVQLAVERGLGPGDGDGVALRTRHGDTRASAIADALARLLGCSHERAGVRGMARAD